jgi:sigma-E factor negative regulatory protein RseC
MRTIDCITQTGIVEEVSEGSLIVSMISKSACSSCHSKAACTSMDMSEKRFTLHQFDPTLKKGEKVLLKMHKSLGSKAVFLGYGLPFIVFFTCLLILTSVLHNEVYAGLGSIFSLVLYYLVLKLFTKQVQSAFTFEVERV